MAWGGFTYGDRFYADFGGLRDGAVHRIVLALASYGGSAEELRGVTARFTHGDQSTNLYEALPPQTLTVTLFGTAPGLLSGIAERPDGSWQMRWERTYDGTTETLWTGYVVPARYRDDAYESRGQVTITADDGFRLLESVEHDQSGNESLLDSIRAALMELRGIATTTAMRWRPWLPVALDSATDPMAAIHTKEDAWMDGVLRRSRLYALRSILERFQLRAAQSGGRWHVWQRPAQAASERWHYDSAGASETGPTEYERSETALIRRGAPRETVGPARSAAVRYDFFPPLDNAIQNGGFEDVWPDPNSTATYSDRAGFWDIPDTGTGKFAMNDGTQAQARRVRAYLVIPGHSATAQDQWALQVASVDDPLLVVTAASQDGYVYLAGGDGHTLEIRAHLEHTLMDTFAPPIYLSVGTDTLTRYYMASASLEVARGVTKGKGVFIALESPAPGSSGAVLIPEGATLYAGTVAVTLKEAVKSGDTALRADIEDNLAGGELLQYYTWSTTPTILTPMRQEMRAQLVYEDGSPVTGFIRVEMETAVETDTFGGTADPTDRYYALTHFEGSVLTESGAVSATTVLVQDSAALHGRSLELSVLLGDGPATVSATSLLCEDDDGEMHTTLQGDDTGWKVGAFGAAEGTTGIGLDRLAAREALAQERLARERIYATLMLGDGDMIYPHETLVLTRRIELAQAPFYPYTYLWTREPLRVGEAVTVDETLLTITKVTGTGPFSCYTDVAVPAVNVDYVDVERRYSIEYLDLDLPGGAAYVAADELRTSTGTYLETYSQSY